MDYKRIYNEIVQNAKNENRSKKDRYYENHHIIPKSLGGIDEPENLVLLTPREHFICHCLLPKFTNGKDKSKMIFALNGMKRKSKGQDRYINARLFENNKLKCKEELSKRMIGKVSGKNNPMYGKSTSKYVKEFWDNADEEWKEKRNKAVSLGTKKAMDNISPEKKKEMLRKQSISQKQWGKMFYLLTSPEGNEYLLGSFKEVEEFVKSNNLVMKDFVMGRYEYDKVINNDKKIQEYKSRKQYNYSILERMERTNGWKIQKLKRIKI